MTKLIIMIAGGAIQEIKADSPDVQIQLFDMDLAEEFDDATETMYEELYDTEKEKYAYSIDPIRPGSDSLDDKEESQDPGSAV